VCSSDLRVAPVYELADGRRAQVPKHIERVLAQEPRGILLDLGAGTGFITKAAIRYYYFIVAVDISEEMLARIPEGITKLKWDITEELPFSFCFFDKVICVSVLHHLWDWQLVFLEVKRILKRGGVFYSDLDLDALFYKRFKYLLKLYRFLRQPAKRYARRLPHIEELYHKAEVRAKGIDTDLMIDCLKEWGFSVKVIYHWGNGVSFPRGFAPYASITAKKVKD
jgi:SAM-dependent methyltransferase